MAEPGSFKVHGKEYNLPTDLTTGEMCDAETEFGVEFGNTQSSGVRMAAAMIWLAIRRVDPKVTVEDIRSLPIDVFESFMGEDDPAPLDPSTSSTSTTSGSDSKMNGAGQDKDQVAIGDLG